MSLRRLLCAEVCSGRCLGPLGPQVAPEEGGCPGRWGTGGFSPQHPTGAQALGSDPLEDPSADPRAGARKGQSEGNLGGRLRPGACLLRGRPRTRPRRRGWEGRPLPLLPSLLSPPGGVPGTAGAGRGSQRPRGSLRFAATAGPSVGPPVRPPALPAMAAPRILLLLLLLLPAPEGGESWRVAGSSSRAGRGGGHVRAVPGCKPRRRRPPRDPN